MRKPEAESLVATWGGTTAVEFALVAPIFLMFVFGVVEFGRLLWTEQALQETAIAGARCMAIAQGTAQSGSCATGGTCSPCAPSGSYSSSATQTYIQAIASNWGLSIPSSGITLSSSSTCAGTGGSSQVTLTSNFVTVVPQIVLLPVGGTSLTATACYPNSA